MQQRIRLDTYDRRSARLYRRRSGRRRTAIAAALVGALLLGAGGVAAWALAGRSPGGNPRPAVATTTAEATAALPMAAPATPAAEPTSAAVAAAPAEPPTITIAAVGDMLFDRKVKQLIEREGGKAPLAEVAQHLSGADVAVGNLETTLANGGKRTTTKEPQYAFRGHPKGIEALDLAGFDAVSLANNHMLDYGPDPMRDTIAALDEHGIGHSGAGENTEAAWKPATIETESGAKVAYLAYTHILPAGFLASADRPGVASGKMDMSMIADAVKKADEDHDYVLVSFHWGVEYEDYANGDQVKKAHQAIDAGADMVLAHHPHVIQGVEFYKGKLIAYSLGDFVFDHYSRKTGESFILDAELGPAGVSAVTATPVYLDEWGRPEFVTGSAARTILKRLQDISKPHGTSVKIDGDTARIVP